MKDQLETAVRQCADKAARADEPHKAMQYAQAALNATHALQVLSQIEKK